MACPANVGGTDPTSCLAAAAGPGCPRGQQLYRLYLSTTAVANRLEGDLCLGSIDDIVPVGNIAAADVARYLRDVRPPPLTLTTSPPLRTLVGLPTYVRARPPSTLRPTPFGSALVHETITLRPTAYAWNWGDGTGTGWISDPGDVYPVGHLTHRYAEKGPTTLELTTRWSGSYVLTIDGKTFGPYQAIGSVTRVQTFALTVVSAHSVLVSH